jgi:hypothetical protein
MHRINKASSYMVAVACLFLAADGSSRQAGSQPASPALNYEYF